MTIYLVKRDMFFFFSSGRCMQIHLLDHKMPSKCGYLDRLLLYRAVRPSLSNVIFPKSSCGTYPNWFLGQIPAGPCGTSLLWCGMCLRKVRLVLCVRFVFMDVVFYLHSITTKEFLQKLWRVSDSPAWKWNKPFFCCCYRNTHRQKTFRLFLWKRAF